MNITLDNCVAIMLAEGERHETIKDRNKLEELLKEENLPIIDKFIEAQIKYGGISYFKYEKQENEEYIFDFCFNMDGEILLNGVWVPEDLKDPRKHHSYLCVEDKNKYYINFMENIHYEIGPIMDSVGRIYEFSMGRVPRVADSIEEFLENQGIYFYLFRAKSDWFTANLKEEEFELIKKKMKLKNLKTKYITNKYMIWLTNEEETLIIKKKIKDEYFDLYARIEIFCKDIDLLKKIKGDANLKPITIKEYYTEYPGW